MVSKCIVDLVTILIYLGDWCESMDFRSSKYLRLGDLWLTRRRRQSQETCLECLEIQQQLWNSQSEQEGTQEEHHACSAPISFKGRLLTIALVNFVMSSL